MRWASYEDYLQTPEWQATRRAALERAGQRCQRCGSGEQLRVHHRTYVRLGAEEPDDLRVLCDQCHEAVHGIQGKRKSVTATEAFVGALEASDTPQVVRTGLASTDARLGGGLPRGYLTVLASAANVGKTILARQIAASQTHETGVVLTDLHTPQRDVIESLFARVSGIHHERPLRLVIGDPAAHAAVDAGAADLEARNLWLTPTAMTDIDDLEGEIALQCQLGDVALWIIDPCGELSARSRVGLPRLQELDHCVRRIGAIARGHNIAALLVTEVMPTREPIDPLRNEIAPVRWIPSTLTSTAGCGLVLRRDRDAYRLTVEFSRWSRDARDGTGSWETTSDLVLDRTHMRFAEILPPANGGA